MKVSVVIPVFNGFDTLSDSIRSALGQTEPPAEVIIVDDGSTDRTSEILAGFGDQIRCTAQTNRGVAAARNRGAELARGDWIAFLDQDDLWRADKLKTLGGALAHNPQASFLYSDFEIIDESGQVICSSAAREWNLDWIRVFMNGRFHALPSTVLIRKDVFDEIGGFSCAFKANAHEDVEFNARAVRIAEVEFVDEPLVSYRNPIVGFLERHLDQSKQLSTDALRRYCELQVGAAHDDRMHNAEMLIEKLSALHEDEPWLPAAIRRLRDNEALRLRDLADAHASLGHEDRARHYFHQAWQAARTPSSFGRYLASCLSIRLAQRRR